MERSSELRTHVASQAAELFARIHDANDTTAREDLADWLLRSPLHVEEFLAVTRVWGAATPDASSEYSIEALTVAAKEEATDNIVPIASGGAQHESGVINHRALIEKPRDQPLRWWSRPSLWAAGLAGLALIAGGGFWWNISARSHWHYTTAVGEQRSVTLPDGSVVDINTDSDMRVDLDARERRIELLRGEARFKVAKNPARPFIVTTAEARVRAVGTLFNVRTQTEGTAVAVLEGRVEVRELVTLQPLLPPSRALEQTATTAIPDAHGLELAAGQRARVTSTGEVLAEEGPSVDRVAMWPQRRLVFRADSLADVVADFNRYHTRPMLLDDPALAAIRISGTFDSSDPQSLIDYLSKVEEVNVSAQSDGIHLRRLPH
jgi:transmembrane sensor